MPVFLRYSLGTAHLTEHQAKTTELLNQLPKSNIADKRHGRHYQPLMDGPFANGKGLIEYVAKRWFHFF
jgi:hypothetical protein